MRRVTREFCVKRSNDEQMNDWQKEKEDAVSFHLLAPSVEL
jgi:hypothetical protein